MESKTQFNSDASAGSQPLLEQDLLLAVGGTGYSSIRCKKCGRTFADMEQYKLHVEAGCKPKPTR